MRRTKISNTIRLLVSGTSAGLALTVTAFPLVAAAQTAAQPVVPMAATAAGNAAEVAPDSSRGRASVQPNVLPQVTVVGQSVNTNDAPLGISRLPETAKETPKTINIVPQEVIEQQHATSLEQILKNVPGITISTGEGNGGQSGDQFRIRGLSAKGDIYVDGLRDFGAYKRDAFNTESVEVIKGPSGESFGVGNVGGLINQTTKKANLNTSTSIDQGFASDATYRTTLDSNVKLGDTSALRINGMFQNGRVADRDHIDDDRRGVAIDFGTGLGTSTEWHLNYSYLHRSGAPDFGVPVAPGADGIFRPLTAYNVPGIKSSTSYVRNTDRDTTDAHIVSSNFVTKLDNGITISNDTRFSFYERDFSSTNPAALTYANLQSLLAGRNVALPYGAGGGTTYLQRGWGIQNVLSAKGEFTTAGFRHKAMVGLDTLYQRDHRDQGSWTGRQNNQTVVNPIFFNSPNATVSYNSTRDANAIDVGAFVSDRVWLTEQFSLLGSLRWDYFRSEYATSASTLGGAADSKKLSPAISAIWEPTKDYMFYTSFSRTYRPVGTDIAVAVGGVGSEVPQNGFNNEPERADTIEVGAKLDFLDKRLGVTGALFQTKKYNAYTIDPATGDITNGFSDSGEGRRIRGLELGLSGRIVGGWTANVAYAYLNGEVTSATAASTVGNTAPGVSRHNVTLWTAYDIPHTLLPVPGQLTIGGGLQYATGYWADSANTAKMPDNFSLDAMIAYKQGKYRISLNGYNLTNHLNYQSSFGAVRAVPTSRRTVLLNVGMTF